LRDRHRRRGDGGERSNAPVRGTTAWKDLYGNIGTQQWVMQ
jgi:hypothetical protein